MPKLIKDYSKVIEVPAEGVYAADDDFNFKKQVPEKWLYMVDKVMIYESCLMNRIEILAKQIANDYHDNEISALIVLKGAFVFASDLMRELSDLKVPVKIDFIKATSYGNKSVSSGAVSFDLGNINVKNKDVLTIEDIIDTGKTLKKLKEYLLNEKHAKSVKICTLLNKPERREADIKVDYIGFNIPNRFIAGYGIDYSECFRELPFVVALKEDVLEK